MKKKLSTFHDKMINNLLRQKLELDFILADKIILSLIIVLCCVVAVVTPWQHGYFKLGIFGGLFITAICLISYKTVVGTVFCRSIFATALVALLAITVQQSNGLGEGHFLFFIGFIILSRYNDVVPVLIFIGLVVIHHLTLTYCQSINLELWGQSLSIFSWGNQTEWGLLAPLIYHLVFAILGALISIYYIFARNKAVLEVWQHSNFDVLTELPNRRMFRFCLEKEINKANRTGKKLALLFIDLDHFKEINDTFGHDWGDKVLKKSAQRITDCVRESGIVARLSGDEFTLIIGDLDDPTDVACIADDILNKLSKTFHIETEVAHVTASIGITFYPDNATSVDELLKNADQAMYVAKEQGRNRCQYYTPSIKKAALARGIIVNNLPDALANNEFNVVYQPIVELSSGAIHKAEALIRWHHPTHGFISPADFISIAEETGLIIDIGEWVFQQAAQQVKQWRTLYDKDFQISVNTSPVQYHDSEYKLSRWFDYLNSLGLSGNAIVAEITEGVLMDSHTDIVDMLSAFREGNIRVSLDDFGTGYSSLSYLRKFDIDYLKIDQSFVRNMQSGSKDIALCEAIIVMAHKLGLKVIAEGIETEEHRALLILAGCDYGQGYLFSKPVPPVDFEKCFSAR